MIDELPELPYIEALNDLIAEAERKKRIRKYEEQRQKVMEETRLNIELNKKAKDFLIEISKNLIETAKEGKNYYSHKIIEFAYLPYPPWVLKLEQILIQYLENNGYKARVTEIEEDSINSNKVYTRELMIQW